jgi:Tol biopolymer transport system component
MFKGFIMRSVLVALLAASSLHLLHAQDTPTLTIGEVVFTSALNGNPDIFAMNPDGTELRALTDSPANDNSPVWSPDGQHILFLSERDGGQDVFIMNNDGSEQRNITQSVLDEYAAGWSPDAQQIVFARADSEIPPNEGGTVQLFILDLQTGEETQLTASSAFNNAPTWSPDGAWIAYVSDIEGTPQIYKMRVDGSETIRMTTTPDTTSFNPAWSPNGQWLAFDSVVSENRDIYVMREDGTNLRRLTDHPDTDMLPVWTFDGLRLMFSSDRTGVMQIYRMDAGGRGVVRITNSRTSEKDASCLWVDPNTTP